MGSSLEKARPQVQRPACTQHLLATHNPPYRPKTYIRLAIFGCSVFHDGFSFLVRACALTLHIPYTYVEVYWSSSFSFEPSLFSLCRFVLLETERPPSPRDTCRARLDHPHWPCWYVALAMTRSRPVFCCLFSYPASAICSR